MSATSETETSRGVWRGSSLASSSGRVNLLLFVLSLAICSTMPSLIQPHHLEKRDATQFYDLVNRYTGRGCVDYDNYGCYCGVGNIPRNPVDDTDKCCQDNEQCYANSTCTITPLRLIYSITCSGLSCTCEDSPVTDPCRYNVCQCDVTLGQCLLNANSSYDSSYKGYCPL